MTLIDFIKDYPYESSCKAKFKAYREQVGVVCPKCGSHEHYWKRDKESYECKQCKYRQGLRANTIIHKSKLSYRYWFIAMHLLTSTKKSFQRKSFIANLDINVINLYGTCLTNCAKRWASAMANISLQAG